MRRYMTLSVDVLKVELLFISFDIPNSLPTLFVFRRWSFGNAQISHSYSHRTLSYIKVASQQHTFFMYSHVAMHRKTAWLLFSYFYIRDVVIISLSLCFSFVSFFLPSTLCLVPSNYCLWIRFFVSFSRGRFVFSPEKKIYLQTCFLHFRLGIRILRFLPPSEIHCIIFLISFSLLKLLLLLCYCLASLWDVERRQENEKFCGGLGKSKKKHFVVFSFLSTSIWSQFGLLRINFKVAGVLFDL